MAETQVTRRQVAAALRLAGVSTIQMKKVSAQLSGEGSIGPVVKRDVIKRIRQGTPNIGDAVVVARSENSYRVYSMEGYKAMKANGQRRAAEMAKDRSVKEPVSA